MMPVRASFPSKILYLIGAALAIAPTQGLRVSEDLRKRQSIVYNNWLEKVWKPTMKSLTMKQTLLFNLEQELFQCKQYAEGKDLPDFLVTYNQKRLADVEDKLREFKAQNPDVEIDAKVLDGCLFNKPVEPLAVAELPPKQKRKSEHQQAKQEKREMKAMEKESRKVQKKLAQQYEQLQNQWQLIPDKFTAKFTDEQLKLLTLERAVLRWQMFVADPHLQDAEIKARNEQMLADKQNALQQFKTKHPNVSLVDAGSVSDLPGSGDGKVEDDKSEPRDDSRTSEDSLRSSNSDSE